MTLSRIWSKLGVLESWSLILLVTVAMPLKYLWGQPLPVRFLGMTHGVLFITYNLLTLLLWQKQKWSFYQWIEACAAAWIPFGYLHLEHED